MTARIDAAIDSGNLFGLVLLAFLAVMREALNRCSSSPALVYSGQGWICTRADGRAGGAAGLCGAGVGAAAFHPQVALAPSSAGLGCLSSSSPQVCSRPPSACCRRRTSSPSGPRRSFNISHILDDQGVFGTFLPRPVWLQRLTGRPAVADLGLLPHHLCHPLASQLLAPRERRSDQGLSAGSRSVRRSRAQASSQLSRQFRNTRERQQQEAHCGAGRRPRRSDGRLAPAARPVCGHPVRTGAGRGRHVRHPDLQGARREYRFDYGGHRFITKNPGLLAFIDELMGDDLLHAERRASSALAGAPRLPLNLPNLLKTAPLALMAGAVKDLLLLPCQKPTEFCQGELCRVDPEPLWPYPLPPVLRGLHRQVVGHQPGQALRRLGWPAHQPDRSQRRERAGCCQDATAACRCAPMPANTAIPNMALAGFSPPWGAAGGRGWELKTGATITRLEQVDGRIEQVYWKQDDVEQSERFDQVISTLPLPLTLPASGFAVRSALPVASLRQYAPQTGEPVGQHLAVPLRPHIRPPACRSPASAAFMAPSEQTSVMLEILPIRGCHGRHRSLICAAGSPPISPTSASTPRNLAMRLLKPAAGTPIR